jgi:3-oxoacyl-[acyl-carrier-protein] synthase II
VTTNPTRDDVVVTGIGLITPAGRGLTESWQGVLAGKPTAAADELLVGTDSPVHLTCRVPDYDADAELGRGASRRLDRFTQVGLLAAFEALQHAGLTEAMADGDVDADRVGVLLGSGIGGAETWEEAYPGFFDRGPRSVSPLFVPKVLSNSAAGMIALRAKLRGPNMTVNTACAAGASALHLARDLIRAGSADVVLAGGSEAAISGLSVAAFAQMGALSTNPDPNTVSRPFDAGRDGFVMGEGAGVLVLERAEHAAARGAQPLARLAGAGASADAHHPTAPPEDGAGAVLALRRALADAGLAPEDVGHYNAHGTSTPLNDLAESRAVRAVFGAGTDDLVVTSTKGVTGHLLGAAGAVEAAFAVLALREGLVPPTAGLRELDPEIALDVVRDEPREVALDAVMSASFGFGGQNAAVILTRP